MEVLVQQWTDRFPHVGYGIVEEMAFALSSNQQGCPSEIEIESFLFQMNNINQQQQYNNQNNSLQQSGSIGSMSPPRQRHSVINRGGGGASSPNNASIGEEEDDEDTAPTQQLLVFTSTVTSSRQVRDHDRQIRNLLYLLKLPFDVMDVADNKFVQNQVVKMVQNALKNSSSPDGSLSSPLVNGGGGKGSSSRKLPGSAADLLTLLDDPPALLEKCLPIIFYQQELIGTYLDLQYYVDDEPNHASLRRVLKEVGCNLKV